MYQCSNTFKIFQFKIRTQSPSHTLQHHAIKLYFIIILLQLLLVILNHTGNVALFILLGSYKWQKLNCYNLTLVGSSRWIVVRSIWRSSILGHHRYVIFVFHFAVKWRSCPYDAGVSIHAELLVVNPDLFDPIVNLSSTVLCCCSSQCLILFLFILFIILTALMSDADFEHNGGMA